MSDPSESQGDDQGNKKQRKKPPRVGGRKRRGHKAQTEAREAAEAAQTEELLARVRKRASKSTRQLDPEAFRQVDAMIASFAQRRFGPMIPELAKGFFGSAKPGEHELPELKQAFSLFCVYGYRDQQGLRILDMFSRFGLKLEREQQRVVDACLRSRFVVFGLERSNQANKQMLGRDILRGLPMTLLDHNAYARVKPGDVLIAYMFPMGDLWRAIGMATKVERAKVGSLRQGLDKLARDQGFAPAQLADRRPAQIFWLGYRAADLNLPAKI